MEGFEKVAIAINDFDESNKEYTIDVLFRIKFIDYLASLKGTVLKGSNRRKLVMTYKLTYVKSVNTEDNKCPNCNAPLENVASSICPFCKSVIISDTHNYVLAKKQLIKQRME